MFKRIGKIGVKVMYAVMVGLLILGLCGCGEDEVDVSGMVLSASVSYNGDSWEVYKSQSEDKGVVLKNSKLEKEITDLKDVLPLIALPKVESSKDLDRSLLIGSNIYDVSMVSALEYKNYLEDNGYEQIFEAYTSQFYETYLRKDQQLKRLIITKNYMLDYYTDSINFSIDDYTF